VHAPTNRLLARTSDMTLRMVEFSNVSFYPSLELPTHIDLRNSGLASRGPIQPVFPANSGDSAEGIRDLREGLGRS
jgi:hypothetical protein